MNPADIALGIVKVVLFLASLGGCAMQQQTPADLGFDSGQETRARNLSAIEALASDHATEAAGEEFTNDQTPADGIRIVRKVKGVTNLF